MKAINLTKAQIIALQGKGYDFQIAGTQAIFGYLKCLVVKYEGQYYTVRKNGKDGKLVTNIASIKGIVELAGHST